MEQSINMIKYKGNDNMFKVLKTTSLSVCGAVPLGARTSFLKETENQIHCALSVS
jgi:predicted class III extradiol MEMO1 family dioxygenase